MTTLRSKLIRLAHSDPSLRPHLLPLLKEAAGQYMEVRSLPQALIRALKEVGYGKRDIMVVGKTTYGVQRAGGDGMRGFTAVVDLTSGRTKVEYGSWGGANPFSPQNQVDMDRKEYPIPLNGAVISGTEGGHSVYATIAAHPDNLQKLLPAGEGDAHSEQEVTALQIMSSLIPKARKEYFQRNHLGDYSAQNPLIQGLAKKGLVKVTGAGLQITMAGKNVVEAAPRRMLASMVMPPKLVAQLQKVITQFQAEAKKGDEAREGDASGFDLVLSLLKRGKFSDAYRIWSRMDTEPRDYLSNAVYDYMVGGLMQEYIVEDHDVKKAKDLWHHVKSYDPDFDVQTLPEVVREALGL